jgi:hypothetical protein
MRVEYSRGAVVVASALDGERIRDAWLQDVRGK